MQYSFEFRTICKLARPLINELSGVRAVVTRISPPFLNTTRIAEANVRDMAEMSCEMPCHYLQRIDYEASYCRRCRLKTR